MGERSEGKGDLPLYIVYNGNCCYSALSLNAVSGMSAAAAAGVGSGMVVEMTQVRSHCRSWCVPVPVHAVEFHLQCLTASAPPRTHKHTSTHLPHCVSLHWKSWTPSAARKQWRVEATAAAAAAIEVDSFGCSSSSDGGGGLVWSGPSHASSAQYSVRHCRHQEVVVTKVL